MKPLAQIVTAATAECLQELRLLGISDKLTVCIKPRKSMRGKNWVGCYRGQTQFRNGGRGPIFWISEEFVKVAGEMGNITERSIYQGILDTLYHEYWHVIVEFSNKGPFSDAELQPLRDAISKAGDDEEEAAEEFHRWFSGARSDDRFRRIIEEYAKLAFEPEPV
jgi:hypothetical protein